MRLPYDTRFSRPGQTDDAEPLVVSAVADGSGTATASAPPVPLGSEWLIDYLTTSVEGSALEPALNVYTSSSTARNFLDGTATATAAVAVYQPPRRLGQGEQLLAEWSGCTLGARCTLRIEYRRARAV